MSHENEYHDAMVQLLELIWGNGYMAPGGPGNVAKMLQGIDTAGKRILDIGSGIGGPAREMASTHGAEVVGMAMSGDRMVLRLARDGSADVLLVLGLSTGRRLGRITLDPKSR